MPAAIVALNVHPLPTGLSPALGAAAEPLACAVHTVRGCGPLGGRRLLVLGGGVQGQFLARLAARAGAAVTLLDPHPDRREMAVRNGAARALPVPEGDDAVAGLGEEVAADLVIEAVGRPAAWRMAVNLASAGGEVVFHGGCPAGADVALPSGPIHYSELTLRGAYHHTPDAFAEALATIAVNPGFVAELLHTPIGLADVPHALSASRGVKHPVMPVAPL